MENLFQHILDTVHAGVWVTDAQDRIVYMNPALEHIAGAPAVVRVGRSIHDFPESSKSELSARYNQARETLTVVPCEWTLVHAAGKPVLLSGYLTPRVEEDRFAGMIGSFEKSAGHKKTEQALLEAGTRAERYLNIAPVIILALDVRGNITLLNEAGKKILECGDEVIGNSWIDTFMSEAERREAWHVFSTLMEGNAEVFENIDGTVLTRSGKHRLIHWHNTLTHDAEGNISGILSSGQDITEHRKTELALRESESFFRSFVENANDIVYALSTEGIFTYVSPNWEELVGGSPDEVIGKAFRPFVHPDDAPLCEAFLQKVLAGPRKQRSVEYRVRTSDGQWRWHVSNGSVLQLDDAGPAFFVGIARDVTERKQMEDALRENREILRKVIDMVPAFICAKDIDGRFILVNQALADFYGVAPEQLTGKFHQDIAEDDEEVRQMLAADRAVIENGRPLLIPEETMQAPDGEAVILETHKIPFLASGKKAVLIAALDITERRQAEKAREASEKLYRSLAENFPDGVLFLLDQNMRYLAADGKELSKAGLSRDLLIGRTIQEVFPELWPTLERYTGRALQGENVYYEVPYRGQTYSNQAVGIPGPTGQTEQVIIITQNITERQAAETSLRESEKRFRTLLNDITTVSVQGYSTTGRTIYWNKASEDLYGYTAEEALGKSLLDLIIPPKMRDDVTRSIEQMAETGKPVPAGELELLRKDGSTVPVFSSHCVYENPTGDRELFCLDVDLTQIRETEAEKEALLEQLMQSQKMESVGRLAGGVAHDFNNMLNVIIGHTEMLLEDLPDNASSRSDLREIYKSAQRSADLTRQLLAFARKQTVSPKDLDLNDAIGSMLKMLGRLIGEDIDLLWQPGPNLNRVLIDPIQVDQVLANLVVNARDAIEGVGKITIETQNVELDEDYCRAHRGFQPGRFVMLAVSDTGCGMDATARKKIFEPFYTTKEVGKGTGLGLATVYGIIKQNQGFINLYSEPRHGTTFRIYFPALEKPATEDSATDEKEAVLSSAGETILVVEDEPAILTMTVRILERLGYVVIPASTPSEAIAAAEAHSGQIDLMLTDVVMPDMNGRDLARRLEKAQPDMHRLYMSGYTANVIAHHGVLDPDVHFIQKPFSMMEIGRKIHEVLNHKT